MDHGTVLHIGLRPEDDLRDVPSQNRMVPDAGPGPDLDIGHQGGIRCDVSVRRDPRGSTDITANRFDKFFRQIKGLFVHASNGPAPPPPVKTKSWWKFLAGARNGH